MDYLEEFKLYLEEEQRSQNTISCYIRDVMQFRGWSSELGDIGVQEMAQINLTHFSKYLKSSGQAYKTINRKFASINTFYKFMFEKKFVSERLSIKPIKFRTQHTFKGLDDKQFWKLRTEVHRGKNKMHICIFELLFNTGVRVSELVNIKLSDIETSQRKGTLTVLGKGDVVREIPLNNEARKVISEYLEVRRKIKSEYLFIGQRGALKRNAINLILNNYGERVGIEITPHMLRHTLGYRLMKNGSEITTIQQILGHANVNTSGIYGVTSINSSIKALECLN